MLRKVFTTHSPYKKRARTLAIMWTLLIFILCFIPGPLTLVFLAGVTLGWIVEELQGLLTSLGRSKSIGDIYADAIGSLFGVLVFAIISVAVNKRE